MESLKKTNFMDKYPVYSMKIQKKDTKYKNIDEIVSYLKTLIESHKVATFIAVFDHYTHTKSLKEHEINKDIKDAKNLIFCFGKQISDARVLAVRPRSIGISEFSKYFSIDFMEAPNEQLHKTLESWIESL